MGAFQGQRATRLCHSHAAMRRALNFLSTTHALRVSGQVPRIAPLLRHQLRIANAPSFDEADPASWYHSTHLTGFDCSLTLLVLAMSQKGPPIQFSAADKAAMIRLLADVWPALTRWFVLVLEASTSGVELRSRIYPSAPLGQFSMLDLTAQFLNSMKTLNSPDGERLLHSSRPLLASSIKTFLVASSDPHPDHCVTADIFGLLTIFLTRPGQGLVTCSEDYEEIIKEYSSSIARGFVSSVATTVTNWDPHTAGLRSHRVLDSIYILFHALLHLGDSEMSTLRNVAILVYRRRVVYWVMKLLYRIALLRNLGECHPTAITASYMGWKIVHTARISLGLQTAIEALQANALKVMLHSEWILKGDELTPLTERLPPSRVITVGYLVGQTLQYMQRCLVHPKFISACSGARHTLKRHRAGALVLPPHLPRPQFAQFMNLLDEKLHEQHDFRRHTYTCNNSLCSKGNVDAENSSNTRGSFRRCSNCLRARYCDVDCQRQDWEQHRLVCQESFKSVPSPRETDFIHFLTQKFLREHLEEVRQYYGGGGRLDLAVDFYTDGRAKLEFKDAKALPQKSRVNHEQVKMAAGEHWLAISCPSESGMGPPVYVWVVVTDLRVQRAAGTSLSDSSEFAVSWMKDCAYNLGMAVVTNGASAPSQTDSVDSHPKEEEGHHGKLVVTNGASETHTVDSQPKEEAERHDGKLYTHGHRGPFDWWYFE
ncbi:hypothetical protein BDZ89DRAFT_9173 [Hymenopellis radicata]|nr:hypothetical protein BDZ89DRAFT_9173 [Hymenopellis radicata]